MLRSGWMEVIKIRVYFAKLTYLWKRQGEVRKNVTKWKLFISYKYRKLYINKNTDVGEGQIILFNNLSATLLGVLHAYTAY